MDLKVRGRNIVQRKLENLERYGQNWDIEDLNTAIDYFSGTFVVRYFKK